MAVAAGVVVAAVVAVATMAIRWMHRGHRKPGGHRCRLSFRRRASLAAEQQNQPNGRRKRAEGFASRRKGKTRDCRLENGWKMEDLDVQKKRAEEKKIGRDQMLDGADDGLGWCGSWAKKLGWSGKSGSVVRV